LDGAGARSASANAIRYAIEEVTDMGKKHKSGSATERFHDALSDAGDGVTATVESVANGATKVVSDVGDKVRDATMDSAQRAADARELVHQKAHAGVAAVRNYPRQVLAITASVAIATIVRLAARRRRRGATTPPAPGSSSTAGLVGL
jgi:hypothetical protein